MHNPASPAMELSVKSWTRAAPTAHSEPYQAGHHAGWFAYCAFRGFDTTGSRLVIAPWPLNRRLTHLPAPPAMPLCVRACVCACAYVRACVHSYVHAPMRAWMPVYMHAWALQHSVAIVAAAQCTRVRRGGLKSQWVLMAQQISHCAILL